jgi:polynucleotide 5'-kinase involved in rRNA processing
VLFRSDREKRKSLRELGFGKALDNSKLKVYPISHVTVEGDGKNLLSRPREYENLLVGLHSLERKFLGLGIIRDVDFTRKAIKIQTAVEEKPAFIALGKVRLDAYLHESPKDSAVV